MGAFHVTAATAPLTHTHPPHQDGMTAEEATKAPRSVANTWERAQNIRAGKSVGQQPGGSEQGMYTSMHKSPKTAAASRKTPERGLPENRPGLHLPPHGL